MSVKIGPISSNSISQRDSFLTGPLLHPIYQPSQKFFLIPYIDLFGKIRQGDFGPGHVFVAAGRSELTNAFLSDFSGIFSYAVISENNN
jgi:hypothetical protein